MPLKLDIKKKLTARSDRVKCLDIHPTEPWILASLFNGNVYIWNYTSQNLVKTFEITDLPVRTAKFVSRKQWVVTGSDDMMIRCYNYNTMEKLKTFEAHSDYIRCVVVHPTQPYVLSSSDDMLIKLWDWEKNWTCTQIFEGHSHYVMMLAINPKDTNTFASASLDRTIKVWGLGSGTPHFTLDAHEKGVNCVEYFIGGEKPYLVSGADDKLVKVWDYQNKTCVQTLEGHTHNVSVVCYHPELPVIISGSEDGTLRIWHANTYRLEKTLNYGMERVWCVAYLKGTNLLAVGYDEGTVMLKLGREQPAVSMDQSGKIIWARGNEIQTANIKTAADQVITDGERIQIGTKELGNCEVYPQTLKHNPNGRFVVVCGDGEYIIYTALAWRNKSFGSALEFVWSTDANQYATRESNNKIKISKDFKEAKSLRPNFSAEGIFGGGLLGVKGKDFVCLYDWEECRIIRRIDVEPKQIYWSDNNEMVAITSQSAFYILKYSKQVVDNFFSGGAEAPEEGIEDSFEILHEIGEGVGTGVWVGDCFIYTNKSNRLNYCIGGQIVTISHLDRKMYLLGYLAKEGRLYLVDKALNVVSYTLDVSVINFQTAVLRGDMNAAAQIMPTIKVEQRNRIAQFLDAQGFKEQALQVSTDPDHKFELAVQLGKLEIAEKIANESSSEHKWKQLGDLALQASQLELVENCLLNCDDANGLLLLYVARGDGVGLEKLAQLAMEKGKSNVAFMAYFLLRRVDDCLNVLISTNRIPEAAFFARTYKPSAVSRIVKLWKEDLKSVNERAAESLADPMEYQNLFPDLTTALKAEKFIESQYKKKQPSSSYAEFKDDIYRDLIEEVKTGEVDAEEEESLADIVGELVSPQNVATPPTPQKSTVEPQKVQTPPPSSPAVPQKVESPVTPQKAPETPQKVEDEELDALEKELEQELQD